MSDKTSCSVVLVCLALVLGTAASAQDYAPRRGSSPGNGYVSLRDYVEQHFRADAENLALLRSELLTSVQLAKDAAEATRIALEARFASVNEFRAQLAEQAAHFATREAVEPQFAGIQDRLGKATERLIALEGLTTRITINTGIIENLGNRLVALESAGSPIAVRNETDIAKLNDRVTAIESKGAGVNQAWTVAAAAAGLLFGAITVWLAIRPRPTKP